MPGSARTHTPEDVSAMPRALVLGGTGTIGRATALRLLEAGWEVDVTGRDPSHMPADVAAAGGTFLASDRGDDRQLAVALGDGADLLVDCICFTAADATRVLPLARNARSTVMISSKAVYVDSAGRHSNSETAPRFDGPIRETQPTVAPGSGDYATREGYGANKVAAEHVLLASGEPITVLRPSKVHGVGAWRPREWVFVRRALDRRPAVVLARRGSGVDHTTAAVNIAALIEVAAARPGSRILNSADPDAPSALEIARTVARQLDHTWEEVLLDDGTRTASWVVIPGTRATRSCSTRPRPRSSATSPSATTRRRSRPRWTGSRRPPATGSLRLDEEFFAGYLDYAAEDAYLADRRG